MKKLLRKNSNIQLDKMNTKLFSNAIKVSKNNGVNDFLCWFDNSETTSHVIVSGYRDFFSYILVDEVYNYIKNKALNLSVLDIGCGGGRLMNAAATCFEMVYGVDIHNNLDITKQFLHSQSKNNIILNNIQNKIFLIEDKKIDLVYSFIVFQHIMTLDCFKAYLSEIQRVLRDDGIAIIYFGRPKYLSRKVFPYSIINTLFYLFDKYIYERVINLLFKGYREYPNVPVNYVNLVVTMRKAKQLFKYNGFIIISQGVSRRKGGYGTQYYLVVQKK
ncbi:MAG: class I SAM-dependent methyltransferase [Candidatus Magasanikbacteria bacterium]|jgi:ubiquinone/menaquinone biosynthesis C-methylase UbiE|nr:class I SAM-dependent methyltransferase [Candidatus Magasanikbacteria bacterium]MBT4071548.1 class I SAM-dependent methyltransferase [Candidatus Magasanikbacteria bacterium]